MEKRTILILGAGRSSKALILYLLDHAEEENWHIIVGDRSQVEAKKIVAGRKHVESIYFTIEDSKKSNELLQRADVVISLLPPALHTLVAERCLHYGKHFFTASYVSDKMQSMHEKAKSKDVLFMNECGLDPGIDHMSVKRLIDRIRNKGGKVRSLESYAGGLMNPEQVLHNPWKYKFTWNPMGIVMAGQGTAKFIEQGEYKYITQSEIFRRLKHITIPPHGDFVGYANRNSLDYVKLYDLKYAHTVLRGTLRMKGFCVAWDVFVQLGCTDNTYMMKNVGDMTHRSFINSFLPYDHVKMVEDKLLSILGLDASGSEMKSLQWIGIFDDEPIGLQQGTPALLLQHILNKKWKLEKGDKDMVVLWNRLVYDLDGVANEIKSTLVVIQEEGSYTAMAKGVGLPLAILTKFFLRGDIDLRGVHIPTDKKIYEPVLNELASYGIAFQDEDNVLQPDVN